MKTKKLTYNIYTLGCKVNQYDSGSLAAKLSAAGFFMERNNVDLAIINTCAVTKTALRKGRQMINRVRRENPRAKIVIVGCAVRVYEEEVEKWGGDMVLETGNFDKIAAQISKLKFQISNQFQSSNFKYKNNCQVLNIKLANGKSRYFLKVQDGCRQFCSYCIIPYARGELSSRPAAEVIAEVKQIVADGLKEIVLCGIHLGLYGVGRKTNLTGLIRRLIKIKGLERIRLSSIEVNEVTDGLIELFKKERKLCRHLHIPLQAGCDKILKLMNRPYTTARFADKVKKIRKLMPDIAITTDVIVGFPGETEKNFQSTVKFINKINFSKVHVFSFSAHERTPAAMMSNQVDEIAKNTRAKKLNDLSRRLEKIYAKRFAGKPLSVIIDGRSFGNHYRGKTEYYFDIEFSSKKKYRQGELVIAQA